MIAAEGHQRGFSVFERMFDAFIDPARRVRAMALFLLFYLAVWSLYGAIAKGSQDIHFDMGEMVAWSRAAGTGTPKHPPLGAWLVGAWFKVFPLADWAYYLFAMVLATLALWLAWLLSARYLDAEKRVTGLLLLTLVPFFNFHALKFNANTVLLPLWAATTWWFLRSYETRRAGWAVLAGAAAAAAMLGKYWSIFLLAGLVVAALTDPRRGAYFRSWAPWLTIAVGAVLIAPNAYWLAVHHFEPIDYALDSHPATLPDLNRFGGCLSGRRSGLYRGRDCFRSTRRPAWPGSDRRHAVAGGSASAHRQCGLYCTAALGGACGRRAAG